MRIAAELHAIDLRSSHQFEEEIGAASLENGLFIAKMGFSIRTTGLGQMVAGSRTVVRSIFGRKLRRTDV
jgi:hypothetical protein